MIKRQLCGATIELISPTTKSCELCLMRRSMELLLRHPFELPTVIEMAVTIKKSRAKQS